MPRFIEAVIDQVLLERPGLQRVSLDDYAGRAYVLTNVIGPVAAGDRVVVNTTAVDLGLGTGGWHVVHWNLSRNQWHQPGNGHIMKARYTSVQVENAAGEETLSGRDLAAKPVVVCELHSQMAIVAIAAKQARPDLRIAYVMTDHAALPMAISDIVYELKTQRTIDSTITCGQAFGGDVEAINVASALSIADADLIVVSPGPGTVGTGTTLGFSGFELIGVLDNILRMNGTAYFALRYSDTDQRQRHRGISHHSKTILQYADKRVRLSLPSTTKEGIDWPGHTDVVDVPDLDSSIAVMSMDRDAATDRLFSAYSAAAGIAAAENVTT